MGWLIFFGVILFIFLMVKAVQWENNKTNTKNELLNNNLSINKNGNVSSIFSTKINDQEFNIPINTTIKFLEKLDVNQNDSNSCEREPKEGEIKLSVDYPIYKLKGKKEIIDKIFNEQEVASLRGYNFFIVSKKQFDVLLEETKKYDDYNQ